MRQSSFRFSLPRLLTARTTVCLLSGLLAWLATMMGTSPAALGEFLTAALGAWPTGFSTILAGVVGVSVAMAAMGLACSRASLRHREPGWVNGLVLGVLFMTIALVLSGALLLALLEASSRL